MNYVGFNVYRRPEQEGRYINITPTLIAVADMDSQSDDYHFVDDAVQDGYTYWCFIEAIHPSGLRERSRLIAVTFQPPILLTDIPMNFALHQNYPNPFNPETWMPYDLAHDSVVEIIIYNTNGQLLRRLGIGNQAAGSYLTKERAGYWNGESDTEKKSLQWHILLSFERG